MVQPLAHYGAHRGNLVAQAVGACTSIKDDLPLSNAIRVFLPIQ